MPTPMQKNIAHPVPCPVGSSSLALLTRTILCFVIGFLCINRTPAQVQQALVATASFEFASGLAVDAGGNVYVTGYDAVQDPSNAASVVAKYAPDGRKLWQAGYNTISSVLALDSAGNLYVGGGYLELVTTKYDSNGTQLWTARIHSGYQE